MLVNVTDSAVADLLEACRFLGPSIAGEALVASFERQLANLRRFPHMGGRQFALAHGHRAVLLEGGYVMTYEISDGHVLIRRILHGSRDPRSA